MEESALLRLSVICSVAGLAILFYTSAQTQPRMNIDQIEIDDIGRSIRVCGTIESKRISNNHVFLDMSDESGSIKFVIFNNTALGLAERGMSPTELEQGTHLCAAGTVDEYPKGSGNMELIYRSGDIVIY
jgi:aspartyl/asparaginyl-tRNA synthetase